MRISVLISSNSCECEIFVSKDQRILIFQGTPEYTLEFYFFKNLSGDMKSNNWDGEEIKKQFESHLKLVSHKSQMSYDFRSIIFSFVKK